MNIKNITFREYFELYDKNEYDFYIRNGDVFHESKNVFCVPDFKEMSFGTIKDLQYNIFKGLTDDNYVNFIKEQTGKNDKEIYDYTLVEIIQFRNFVYDSINKISEIETSLLSGKTKEIDLMAGIEKLNVFGTQLQVRELANNDITKYEAIRKIKYSDCLVELVIRKEIAEFEQRKLEILKKQNHA